jgi:hypothetical protein
MNEYLMVKPGLAAGGATTSDLLTMAAIRDTLDVDVSLLTGYCDRLAGRMAEQKRLTMHIDPILDREREIPPTRVADAIMRHSSDDTRIVMSQFFAPREQRLGSVVVRVAEQRPTAIRMHNKLDLAANLHLVELPEKTISLPTHAYMEQRILDVAPQLNSLIIPPIFDEERFSFPFASEKRSSALVRDGYGLNDDDVLIVQPTNIRRRKSPITSLHLAAQVQEATGIHTAFLIAGNTNDPAAADEAARLMSASRKLGVDLLIDGMSSRQYSKINRLGNLILSADMVALPSMEDDVMLTIAEAAYVGAPIYTRAFVDGEGNPLFDQFWESLDCLVQRDFEELPERGLVEQAIEIIGGSRTLDIEANAKFAAEHFTAKGISGEIQVLNSLFDDM